MKAYITNNGELTVKPETELETYALKMWCANYYCGNHSSVLHIDNIEVRKPEE